MPTRTIAEQVAYLQATEPPLTPSERAALLVILKPHRRKVDLDAGW